MTTLRIPPLALCLCLAAVPAAAGGISFDLPRLTFPAPQADTSRDCTPPLLPGAAQPCARSGN
ncbi:MAG: hypothetical protein ACK4NE_06225 [Albidovulum sp.]